MELEPVFQSLKSLLRQYQPPFTARLDSEAAYELWSDKPVVIDGRKKDNIFFASAVIQKNFVGFYYMPVYAHPVLLDALAPDLARLLKGKSCFHIKKLDASLEAQIRSALERGLALYKERGWVD